MRSGRAHAAPTRPAADLPQVLERFGGGALRVALAFGLTIATLNGVLALGR